MPQSAYVVRRRQPWRAALLALFIVGAAVALGIGLYEAGHRTGAAGLAELQIASQGQIAALAKARREMKFLERDAERARHAQRLTDTASVQLERTLRQQHAVIAELREQVAFFRGVAVDRDRGQDLALSDFTVAPKDDTGGYADYALTVMRMRRDGLLTSAELRVSLHGERDGQPHVLDGTDLGGRRGALQSFQFRHFRRVTGTLTWPPDFIPLRAVVQLTALGDDGGDVLVERDYRWPNSHVAAAR
ncbi:MAG: DUF6776 family protein [Pseudomonadota bacterium]